MLLLKDLFRKKNLAQHLASIDRQDHKLVRKLNWLDLTALGIGAIIGTGIFVLTGTAAAGGANHIGAGPALSLSFLITGFACALAAFCYAEFASMMPISGSAYTYSYAAFGEIIAWIMGWCLVLEYAIGNIAVAIGWSGYFVDLLRGFNIHLPGWMVTDYVTAFTRLEYGSTTTTIIQAAPHLFGIPVVINFPAVLINLLVTVVLVYGIKESSRVNIFFVALKLLMVFLFIFVGIAYVKPEHWGHDWNTFAPNGFNGVMTGAALIFFAYIGFDAISTASEETINPEKEIPRGIITSLIAVTILYVVVTVILTGMVDYRTLNVPEPVSFALRSVGADTVAGLISAGAVISMTSVLIVFGLGQPRIFYAMSRDGLLPKFMGKIHPRHKTPYVATIVTGVFVAFFSGFVDIGQAAELTNIGTLIAFILVSIGVLVKRYTDPNLPRPFRVKGIHFVAISSALCSGYIAYSLPSITWKMFWIWLIIGLALYFSYGYRKSRLKAENEGK
ncbi:MAG: amino acid permease [Bacteroidetes bacterium]|nr:amino acid permease [Bacteroidota bacterium]